MSRLIMMLTRRWATDSLYATMSIAHHIGQRREELKQLVAVAIRTRLRLLLSDATPDIHHFGGLTVQVRFNVTGHEIYPHRVEIYVDDRKNPSVGKAIREWLAMQHGYDLTLQNTAYGFIATIPGIDAILAMQYDMATRPDTSAQ